MLDNMKVVSITTCDINNGPGVRCTVWVSGCSHKCPGCHNPELADYDYGKYKLMSQEVLDSLFAELDKPEITGVTFSGGDPLDQPERSLKQLKSLLGSIKHWYPDKTIWIYTGGLYENLIKNDIILELLQYVDVLVDGPFILEQRDITLPFRGSTNQRIIDVKSTLKNNVIFTLKDEIFSK